MKKLILLALLPIIALATNLTANTAQAACSTDLKFRVTNGSKQDEYSTSQTIKINPGNQYSLVFSVVGCQPAQNNEIYNRVFRLTANNNNVVSDLYSQTLTSRSIDYPNQAIALGAPAVHTNNTYTLSVKDIYDNEDVVPVRQITIYFTDGTTPPTQQTPSGGDYTPQNVKATDLTSTSVKISWTTVSPSNSEIVYAKATETLNPDKSPPDRAGSTFTNTDNHLLTLSGLTPGTKYNYVVRSSPKTGVTSTKSATYTFTTKNADGSGGSTGGPAGTGVDSTIGIKNDVDLDKPVGFLFNPLNDDLSRPEAILLRIVNILLMLAGILAVIFIIIGGFLMVVSAGNEARLRQGKKTLIYAIAGLILTLLSFSIVAIIQSVLS